MVLEIGTILTKQEMENGDFNGHGTCQGLKVISEGRIYHFLDKRPGTENFQVSISISEREYIKMCRKPQTGKPFSYRNQQQ